MISSLESSTPISNPPVDKLFFESSATPSILSGSPAFQSLPDLRLEDETVDIGIARYGSFDDLGLHTPPHWKRDTKKKISSKQPPGEQKPLFSSSLPLPMKRTMSAPRSRPKPSTPSHERSGKSISQKIRSGQRSGSIDRWCVVIGSHLKVFL